MKSNSLLLGLVFLVAALAVGITLLSARYVQLTRDLNRAQGTIAQVEFQQNRLKALVAEAAEYAKRDNSIVPLLQGIGLKPTGAAATGTPPAATPPPSGR